MTDQKKKYFQISSLENGIRILEKLDKYLIKKHQVAMAPGSILGENGEGHLRLSSAAGAELFKEGLARITAGLESLAV